MTLPSFLIIGAMKAGSTSLFRWLGAHPDIALPADKEPGFFSTDAKWSRGLEHYEALFPPAGSARQQTGEASVVYSDPEVSERAARRARVVLPSIKLIFLARDPLERLRSHYRHQVQRGREKQPLAAALDSPGAPYVRCSQHHRAVSAWLQEFPREQLCTVRFEDLVRDQAGQWQMVLDFLGLSGMQKPAEAHNVTSDKRVFSPVMRRLFEAGAARYEHLVPQSAKSTLKPLLFRSGPRFDRLLRSSNDEIPAHHRQAVADDFARFQQEIGWGRAASR